MLPHERSWQFGFPFWEPLTSFESARRGISTCNTYIIEPAKYRRDGAAAAKLCTHQVTHYLSLMRVG